MKALVRVIAWTTAIVAIGVITQLFSVPIGAALNDPAIDDPDRVGRLLFWQFTLWAIAVIVTVGGGEIIASRVDK